DETSVSSEDFDMNDSTWISADQHLAPSLSPSQDESMRSPQNLHGQEDDDSSSESCSGNGSSTLNPSTSSSTQGDSAFPDMNGNGPAAPMDFAASADDQPINLCDKLAPAHVPPAYQGDGCSADGLRSRVKYAVKATAEVGARAGARPALLEWGTALPEWGTALPERGRHCRNGARHCQNGARHCQNGARRCRNGARRCQSAAGTARAWPALPEHGRHCWSAAGTAGARHGTCPREERGHRDRGSLRVFRVVSSQTRPTPPHLTSAMAENILAAACESETRKAAKRMRLEIYQTSQVRGFDEPIALDKQHSRDSTAITHSSYSLPASSYSQDPVYINGSLNYSYRGYGSLGGSLQPPASLPTGN
ncbi:NOL4L protein, partial [Nothocercus julius]|nr:NOL4L protein [Nothocercus julius]